MGYISTTNSTADGTRDKRHPPGRPVSGPKYFEEAGGSDDQHEDDERGDQEKDHQEKDRQNAGSNNNGSEWRLAHTVPS